MFVVSNVLNIEVTSLTLELRARGLHARPLVPDGVPVGRPYVSFAG